MRIDTIIDLRGNDYHVEIAIGKLSPLEQERLSQFGGQDVETGGAISATVGETSVTFTLPTRPRRLPDEFPIKFVASLDDDEDAGLHAQAWRQVMEARIVVVKNALLNKSPDFVSENRSTV